MRPFDKPITEITLDDINSLVQNEVPEGKTLDYKRDLYDDKSKKDFLIDVSAFANTVGGYIVVGIEEDDNGYKVSGVEIPDIDKAKQYFNNLLRDSVEPPIRGVEYHAIDIPGGRKVFIIEIPRSISRPHAVKFQNYFRFHGRHSSGNYPFEVDDIRRAFTASETLASKIKNFRNDRLSLISVNQALMPLVEGAKLVLHLIPVSSFELGKIYEISKISSSDMPPIGCSECPRRINFDGIVTYLGYQPSWSYTQLFKNGIIEAVDVQLVEPRPLGADVTKTFKIIPSQMFVGHIIIAVRQYLTVLRKVEVDVPVWICLSLLGVKGYQMDMGIYHPNNPTIDRDDILLPEIYLDDFNKPVPSILKPAFDSLWQACGQERCFLYDKNGNCTLRI